nr:MULTISPECIES: LemA family protein [unclassified Pseudomonas]
MVVIALLVLFIIGIYNTLVRLRNAFQNAFAQIEVQLQRRYDLIPNLVETARGYLKHERDTLEAVINARNSAQVSLQAAVAQPGNARTIAQLGEAEGVLASAMERMKVIVEAYPDLKASHAMIQLTEEITSTENKVSFARQAFNDAVTAYNSYKQSFPALMLVKWFGHSSDATLLQFANSAATQDAPVVSFT